MQDGSGHPDLGGTDVRVGYAPRGAGCDAAGGYTSTLAPGERFSVRVTVTVRIPLLPDFIDANTATGQFLVERTATSTADGALVPVLRCPYGRCPIRRAKAGTVEHKTFELGDFALQKGSVLPDARLGYVTLGELNDARDNVVVCPTWFTATPSDTAQWMTGAQRALDPERYFIVIPNHFGAAVSSSPSNTPPPFDRGRFPHVTTYDNVVAQHRLLTEQFGIERIRLVSSWSMGACQTYAWGALHPEMVQAIAPISGSARTANFNKVFLAGNIRAITTDADWNDGFYTDKPPIKGVKAMAALYAGWGFSEAFYRQEVFRAFGASTVEEFIDYFWDAFFIKCDANDLLAQMWTWWHNDLGDHPTFGGDFEAALGAIRARTIILNAETDSYFPPVDCEYEAGFIKGAETRPIPTIWGHLAPFNPEDQQFIDAALRELLEG